MEDFADQQSEPHADKLYRALRQRHPFSHFKSTLDNLGLTNQWYRFKKKWLAQRAEEWLRDEQVDFIDGKVVARGHTLTWTNEDLDD